MIEYSKTVDNDKFYTKETVAKSCIRLIKNLEVYNIIIEPSAGNGSFSRNIDKCVAYDLFPEHNSIKQQDFFTLKFKNLKDSDRLLFIGNPPFGIRNQLSKKFIKHAISLGASTIAFVLPNVFDKLINQSCFPSNWRLDTVYELPTNSFIANGNECHIPCSFFVWTKLPGKINLRKVKLPFAKEFSFLSRGDTTADFCINGNNGKVKLVTEVTNDKAEHYIKTKLSKTIFENLKYEFKSSVNGGVSWIGQQEILAAYKQYMKEK